MIPTFFPIVAAGKKYVSLDLPHFLKMPKGHEMALIGLTIWSTSRDYSIKKKKLMRMQRLGSTLRPLDYHIPEQEQDKGIK